MPSQSAPHPEERLPGRVSKDARRSCSGFFCVPSRNAPHPEERPWGASRRTQDVHAADRLMDWRGTGFVLIARRHGESALIVELLTEAHGRHAGLVRGGQAPKKRALLQPGNLVAATWRGRLPEHLGAFEIELLRPHAAGLLDDPDRLAALSSAAALI